ncbi:MAG: hypothetical protein N4A68_05670 [Maledivibacter sp.]|nr:hypothetical protein [Maledivibacter sp.]
MLVAEKKYSYDDNVNLNQDIKTKTKKVNKKDKNLFIKIAVMFWVLLISSSLIFILLRYTAITEAEYRVHNLNKQIKELENHIQDKKVEYDSLTRSDIIEEAALNELKMQYPQYEQMVFLSINNSSDLDLTVLEENTYSNEQSQEAQKKDRNIFKHLKASIQKIYSLLD